MPSITFWNRLEPRARSADVTNALAARVRDPAWFLARQWQLGEFQGEDAGTPAYVRIEAKIGEITACGADEKPAQKIALDVPMERAATSEPFSLHDVSLAVELGQTFERLLNDEGVADLRDKFLAAYPIGEPGGDDPVAARLRGLWKGRAINGIALYLAGIGKTNPSGPPAGVPISVPAGPQRVKAGTAVQNLVTWVQDVYGALGAADPATWRPENLDYRVTAYAAAPIGGVQALRADPGRDGELDWYAFDALTVAPPAGLPAPPLPKEVKLSVIPGHVKFRGMPNERFWDFEDGRVDFGAMTPDKRSLGAMVLMDFTLVHGNDWFLVPFEQPLGTLARTTLVQVVDVFGSKSTVPRADAIPGQPRWTMFSTSNGKDLADYLVVPASSAATSQEGPALEDVRFLRDEVANLVWAVEHASEGHLGAPWLGAERAPLPEPSTDPADGLRYRLQTDVPEHWIPFQPVAIVADGSQMALERAILLVSGATSDTPPVLPEPHGKLLAPQGLPVGKRYRVREEEVPREGTRITRVVRLARGADGSSHMWIVRKRSVGSGEGWSGLRFDQSGDE